MDKNYVRIRGTRLGGRYKIANVLTPVYEGAYARECGETIANAELISASPDMLAALQEVLKAPGLQSGLQALCAAAVAKATGRSIEDVITGA
jgi:hypothetical protein